ncbi:MAG: hypothetical protein ACRDJH_11590 [Thermomicrobiales bacterium]
MTRWSADSSALRPAWAILLVLGLALPAASPPGARAAVTLGVSPAVVELRADAGAEGEQSVTVLNGGDEDIEVATAVEAYKGADGERSAVAWLTAAPASFRLEPGESRAVEVAIEVPGGLTSGGRYAQVSFTTGGGAVEGSGAAVAGKVGVAFLVVVEGDGEIERAVALERFAPTLEPDGRVGFRALVRNDGNVHARPTGAVAISDGTGEPFGSLEMPQGGTLLPDDSLLMAARGSLPLDPAARYTARAVVEYGEEEPITAEVAFAPVAALTIPTLSVCENLDRGPTLTLGLRNEGELGLLPRVELALREADGMALGGATPPDPLLLWPGETVEFGLDYPERLVSGEYVLAVRVDYAMPSADGQTILPPVEQETVFAIGGLGDGAAPVCGT